MDNAVRTIAESPESGEPKKGNLSGVYVLKSKIANQPYFIAYSFDDSQLTLLAIGSH